MEVTELKKILAAHKKWLDDEPGGKRAELENATFKSLDLHGIDLTGACLDFSSFTNCDLSGASFKETHCQMVAFENSILGDADFSYASLPYSVFNNSQLLNTNFLSANLFGTLFNKNRLSDVNFKSANLFGVNGICMSPTENFFDNLKTDEYTQGFYPVCPLEGAFIAYKKIGGYIVVLEIPKDARRFSGRGFECRADKAKVLRIENLDGSPADVKTVCDMFTFQKFTWGRNVSGQIIELDGDPFTKVTGGVPFYISRQMAVDSRKFL